MLGSDCSALLEIILKKKLRLFDYYLGGFTFVSVYLWAYVRGSLYLKFYGMFKVEVSDVAWFVFPPSFK